MSKRISDDQIKEWLLEAVAGEGIADVYDRSIIDSYIGLKCEAKDAVELLQRALWKRNQFEENKRPIIRTDKGPLFMSHAFESACEDFRMVHERIPPKTPNKNALIESFHSVLEDECLRRSEFETFADAHATVMEYINFYNERRIHGSLYDLSPKPFREAVGMEQIKIRW